MNFDDLKKHTKNFSPVFALERLITHKTSVLLKRVFGWFLVVLFVLSSNLFFDSSSQLNGLFFFVLFLYLILIALDAMYYSFAFQSARGETNLFELAGILNRTSHKDLTGGLIRSHFGQKILLRCGLGKGTLKEFLSKRRMVLSANNFSISKSENLFSEYLRTIISLDKEFEYFLITHGVNKETLVSSALWTSRKERKESAKERWWSNDRLEAIPRLGRDWAYGKAHMLMSVSSPLRFSAYQDEELHFDEVETLERALTKSVEANALLVGDEGVGKMEVIEGLARKIMRRTAAKELLDKHFFVLDEERLASEAIDLATFEKLILSIFSEASRAGNIIMVIPDMARFMSIGDSIGADIPELLIRFFRSSSVTIIAIVDTENFNRTVSKSRELLQHMEKIQIDSSDENAILHTLEDIVSVLESNEEVFFTYPAIVESVTSARRYFVDDPLFDTAEDLLIDSIGLVRERGERFVRRDDILHAVEVKTGVPTGEVIPSEREKLMRLEELLHERVIGQKEAIATISDSLRRARSGLSNPDRPLGSFLFIGPTGVGKTETTKALSEIFFGPSAPLLRLDMSEYGTEDGINRLIGGFANDNPGILASLLREQPYGVLLLDEFEKANEKVLNLFLQVLDEGVFSDALGRKVSARNTIIIATSNAASSEIFDAVKRGENIVEKKSQIIERIIDSQVFKPELLNRFDGIVLFHPLTKEELRSVAGGMLKKVSWRLKEKGMTLVVTPELLDFLVEKGTDKKFGARPLNRAIQDTVEKIIAERIISGEYKNGANIELTREDLSRI